MYFSELVELPKFFTFQIKIITEGKETEFPNSISHFIFKVEIIHLPSIYFPDMRLDMGY